VFRVSNDYDFQRRIVSQQPRGEAPGQKITLQRLFKRRRISPELLADVQEWLFRVGWVLFFAGTTYAVVKMKVVDGWGRISSKRIKADLEKVGKGEFDYDTLEHLLLGFEERED
jgi:hypothetical protein